MALKWNIFAAAPQRLDDGAKPARYTRAKTKNEKTDAEKRKKTAEKAAGEKKSRSSGNREEKATPKRAAAARTGQTKAADRKSAAGSAAAKRQTERKTTDTKPAEKKITEKKITEKKITEKKATEKKTAEKKPAVRRNTEKKPESRRVSVAAPDKKPEERRESGRERRERQKTEAIFRDRRRAVSRAADGRTVMIVLLTMLFEAFGLLLCAVRTQGTIDTRALIILAALAPLCLITSLVLPRFLPMDPLIMALTNFLCGVSIVILYTVSPDRGMRQGTYYVLGIAAMMVVSLVVFHKRRFKGLTVLSMLLGIGALILPLAFGQWSGGAKNWVSLPVFGSFQPSELVKLSLVLAMAYYFSAHRTVLQMMPAILFASACLLLLMLQRDLGTALIYYLTTLVLFYAACGNVPLTVVGLGGGAGAAMLGYRMFAHVKVRVAMWRNPWSDPLDKGYQIIQALLAIGSGGLFGVGLGQGTPEKIPAYFNDFIFAVICEQLGLIFGMLVLAIYVLLILRGVSIISRSRRSMHMLLGCGVLAMLAIQTIMIVGGVIKMLPLTGVTMPFLSYGGSSLLSCLMMIGILHGVSARAQRDLEDDILGIKE